jgi:hypothetical protein
LRIIENYKTPNYKTLYIHIDKHTTLFPALKYRLRRAGGAAFFLALPLDAGQGGPMLFATNVV